MYVVRIIKYPIETPVYDASFSRFGIMKKRVKKRIIVTKSPKIIANIKARVPLFSNA